MLNDHLMSYTRPAHHNGVVMELGSSVLEGAFQEGNAYK